ncbi:MAG: hypothetical protein ACXAC2_08620 [Candidatus Kariarchaeaceae archaeon]|jgi:hypothetical protein
MGRTAFYLFFLLILLVQQGRAYTFDQKLVSMIAEDNVFLSEFDGNSVTYTGIFSSESGRSVEHGVLEVSDDEMVKSVTFNFDEFGKINLYEPIALSIPKSSTTILIASVESFPNAKTYIYRMENGNATNRIIRGGDLNHTSRIFYINEHIYLGFQNTSTYSICEYDLQSDILNEVFNLGDYLGYSGYTFMNDFVAYNQKLYLAGVYLQAVTIDKISHWVEKSTILELTPIEDGLSVKELIRIDEHILSINLIDHDIWIATLYDRTVESGFLSKDERRMLRIHHIADETITQTAERVARIWEIRSISSADFIGYNNEIFCRSTIKNSDIEEVWCIQTETRRFSNIVTHFNQVAVVMIDENDIGTIIIFDAEKPPSSLGKLKTSASQLDISNHLIFIISVILIRFIRQNRDNRNSIDKLNI